MINIALPLALVFFCFRRIVGDFKGTSLWHLVYFKVWLLPLRVEHFAPLDDLRPSVSALFAPRIVG